eukprot:50411-Pleurochrysis_carterae.AAC.2
MSPTAVHCLGLLSTPMTYSVEGLVFTKSDACGCMCHVHTLSTAKARRSWGPRHPFSLLCLPASRAGAVAASRDLTVRWRSVGGDESESRRCRIRTETQPRDSNSRMRASAERRERAWATSSCTETDVARARARTPYFSAAVKERATRNAAPVEE